MKQNLGVNPYKLGMIGSTGAHTALAAIEEDNFFGKHSGAEPSPTRAAHPFIKSPSGAVIMGWEQTASGYGAHLVFISERTEGRIPALAEVRDAVRREWANARRLEANEKFYEGLLTQYSVTIARPVLNGDSKVAVTK